MMSYAVIFGKHVKVVSECFSQTEKSKDLGKIANRFATRFAREGSDIYAVGPNPTPPRKFYRCRHTS